MRIWLRLLIGSAVGATLGILLPSDNATVSIVVMQLARIMINVGRYAMFPLLFCGLIVAAHKLSMPTLLRLYGRTALAIGITTMGAILIGVSSVLLLSPARIPPIFQQNPQVIQPTLFQLFEQIVPSNMLLIFSRTDAAFVPLIVLALIVGLAARHELAASEQLIGIADGLSRVLYRLVSGIVNWLGIGMIAISAMLLFRLRDIADFRLFLSLVLLLIGDLVLIVLIILPLVARLLRLSTKPFAWLYALFAPIIAGFFSGDAYFALSALVKTANERLGIGRSHGSVIFPLVSTFARGGTAMIATATFILLLQSYSALEITTLRVLWVTLLSFGISFLVGPFYGSGLLVFLAMLSGGYGRGLEEAYLIILPVLPLLIAIGTLLDVVIAGFIAYLVSTKERTQVG